MEIQESGMKFQLEDNNCFRIEKHFLANTNCKNSTRNNKACEFVTFANGRHVFVEAKSSAPKGPTGCVNDLRLNDQPMPDNWCAFDNYTSYLRDIAQKFIDSFHILLAIAKGRHGEEERRHVNLPELFPDKGNVDFVLILNIPVMAGNVGREPLAPLNAALTNEMRPFLKTWKISPDTVKICWPEKAQHLYGFLPEYAQTHV